MSRRECRAMRDGRGIWRQRKGTIKMTKRDQRNRQEKIGNLIVGVHETSEMNSRDLEK